MDLLRVDSQGEVRVITLARPESLNALNSELVVALCQNFDVLANEASIKVVILKGAGRGFCAGGDVKDRMPRERVLAGEWPTRQLVRAMRACPQPIIALLHGPVVGAGLALALAADIRLAGSTLSVRVGLAERGLHGSELGIAWILQRTLPLSIARILMLTQRSINAEEALRLGLVAHVFPDDELEAAGLALAGEIAKSHPQALRLTKRTFDQALGFSELESAMESDERAQILLAAQRPPMSDRRESD
jgi:enoyl-CoA hydratase/carnithine racemase